MSQVWATQIYKQGLIFHHVRLAKHARLIYRIDLISAWSTLFSTKYLRLQVSAFNVLKSSVLLQRVKNEEWQYYKVNDGNAV